MNPRPPQLPPEARWIVLRVDGPAAMGTGHVMRCLTLADALALRGVESLFVSRSLDEGLACLVEGAGHRLHRLAQDGPPPSAAQGPYGAWLGTSEAHDARATLAAIAEHLACPPVAVVVDHYGLGEAFERALAAAGQGPILAIDDLGRRHACDLLLDGTFGKSETDYAGLVPPDCRMMVGSAFALLRPDFPRLRADALARRDRAFNEGAPVRDILVSMGGADPDDATAWVLDALEPLAAERGLVLHALVGPAYPHGRRLDERAVRSEGRVRVHRDVRAMAALLSRMDLCVGAAGSSTWERCCMGLPTVNLVLVDNQRTIAEKLSRAGAVIDGGVFGTTSDPVAWAANHVVPLLAEGALALLSERAREATDGHGAERVGGVLMSRMVSRGPVKLRPVTLSDAELLYRWQSFPGTRRYSRNPDIPQWEEHLAWLDGKIRSSSSAQFIGESDGLPVSFLRIEHQEVSILVDPNLKGLGLALETLKSLQASKNFDKIIAEIDPENIASKRLFLKAGFENISASIYIWNATR